MNDLKPIIEQLVNETWGAVGWLEGTIELSDRARAFKAGALREALTSIEEFYLGDKALNAGCWDDAKVSTIPGEVVYGVWSSSRERFWRKENGKLFCTTDLAEAEGELNRVLEQHQLAGSKYGMEDFQICSMLSGPNAMPPLYGLWLNGWCKDETGQVMFCSDKAAAERIKLQLDAGCEVREVPPEMRFWMAHGVNMVG